MGANGAGKSTVGPSYLPAHIQEKHEIFDGDKLYGNWIDVRLIGDPKDTTKYAEILGIVISSFKYG